MHHFYQLTTQNMTINNRERFQKSRESSSSSSFSVGNIFEHSYSHQRTNNSFSYSQTHNRNVHVDSRNPNRVSITMKNIINVVNVNTDRGNKLSRRRAAKYRIQSEEAPKRKKIIMFFQKVPSPQRGMKF